MPNEGTKSGMHAHALRPAARYSFGMRIRTARIHATEGVQADGSSGERCFGERSWE